MAILAINTIILTVEKLKGLRQP